MCLLGGSNNLISDENLFERQRAVRWSFNALHGVKIKKLAAPYNTEKSLESLSCIAQKKAYE
eukprot:snap_masked-scaffold_8-processed-gene-1.17-mRNA-1 protein AED:1.00 eAED:1.00 QI:0/0/0/0/1/1/4/0/61